jgi:hypothetical protein
MSRKTSRGNAFIEFALISLFLVPLLLGTLGIGVNMIRTLQTVQLARDVGHMYARNVDFALPGNKTILADLGEDLGLKLTTPASGSAVVILSALGYVDRAACALGGAVDGSGNPSGCTNFEKWVFTQRLVFGDELTVRTSSFGSPTGVTVNATTGKITPHDYVTNQGARATFSSINPYQVAIDGSVSGLPSGQVIYVSEAASIGFSMRGVVPNAKAYSYALF